jgi:hypothetical protein
MADSLLLLATILLFAVALAYTNACDSLKVKKHD